MVKVYFTNRSKIKIDRSITSDIKKSAAAAAAAAAVAVKADPGMIDGGDNELTVTLCDDAYIRKLNSRFRGIDRETDTLSFPMCDDDIDAGPRMLGDIIISAERAVSQAEEYGHSLRRELCFLCVHSALHLMGINHENGEAERAKMEKMQDEILDSLKITRDI